MVSLLDTSETFLNENFNITEKDIVIILVTWHLLPTLETKL